MWGISALALERGSGSFSILCINCFDTNGSSRCPALWDSYFVNVEFEGVGQVEAHGRRCLKLM